jgi:hypothetical protein
LHPLRGRRKAVNLGPISARRKPIPILARALPVHPNRRLGRRRLGLDPAAAMGRAMTDAKDGRAERLKAALRENLRRRKAQGRGRAEPKPPQSDGEPGKSEADQSGPDSDKTGL